MSDPRGILSTAALLERARDELVDVGDAAAGEWIQVGELAATVHLRRRLAPGEASRVGQVVDIRGTWEATRRLNRVRRYLPTAWRLRPDADLP